MIPEHPYERYWRISQAAPRRRGWRPADDGSAWPDGLTEEQLLACREMLAPVESQTLDSVVRQVHRRLLASGLLGAEVSDG